MRTTRRRATDLAVLERGVGADHGVLPDDGRAEELGAGQDRHVGCEQDGGVDPGRRGVHHGHALAHPVLDDAAVELASELGQLDAVVGTLGLHHVVERERADREPRLAGQADDVGEVVLALGVVVAHARQGVDEELGVEGEDAGVDLADLALLGRGVLLLDDRLDVALGVADDPAVADGVAARCR